MKIKYTKISIKKNQFFLIYINKIEVRAEQQTISFLRKGDFPWPCAKRITNIIKEKI